MKTVPAKNRLFQTVRHIKRAKARFGLWTNAIEYLIFAAEVVAPDDCEDGCTPYFYERVDDIADRLGLTPRAVRDIEKRLVELGFIDKNTLANGHRGARRSRKTGELLWVHGISLAPLLARCAEIEAVAGQIEEEERMFRSARQRVHQSRARLIDAIELTACHPALADLRAQAGALLDTAPARIIRQHFDADELARITARLTMMRDALIDAAAQCSQPVDNCIIDVDTSDEPEAGCRHKYDTTPNNQYSCSQRTPPMNGGETISEEPHPDGRGCWGKKNADVEARRKTINHDSVEDIPIQKIGEAMPEGWRAVLGPVPVSWDVLPEVAQVMAHRLGVAPHLWSRAFVELGPRAAAAALLILDRNRQHPTHPVRSVGGTLHGMLRNAETDELHLAASMYGVLSRQPDRIEA